MSSDNYDLYYAYLKSETDELATAHVALQIGNEKLALIIKIDEAITVFDLEQLLTNLHNNVFSRHRIDIAVDSKVFLHVNDERSQVILQKENNKIKVTLIEPIVDKQC